MKKQPKDREPSGALGRRPPGYVIVVSASDWLKDRFSEAATSLSQALQAGLSQALQAGKERHREPEPDLEAEP